MQILSAPLEGGIEKTKRSAREASLTILRMTALAGKAKCKTVGLLLLSFDC